MPSTVVQVLVHVAGLAVWSNQIPGDPGLKVIVPRIVYSGDASVQHVEDHIPIIAVKTANIDKKKSTWGTIETLPGSSDYSYVRLAGERIGFDTRQGSNGSQATNGTTSELKLPRLSQLCSGTATLKPEFLPPLYKGVAGLFEVPTNAKACMPTTVKRMDAEFELKANDALIIYSGSGTARKELRITAPKGSTAEVIIANVPTSCFTGHCDMPAINAVNGLPHIRALYEMGAGDGSTCKDDKIAEWYFALNNKPGTCTLNTFPAAAGGPMIMPQMASATGATGVDPLKDVGVYNFQCSDTQWP